MKKKEYHLSNILDKKNNQTVGKCKQSITHRFIEKAINKEALIKTTTEITNENNKKDFFRFYDKLRKKVSKKTHNVDKIESLNIKDLLFLLPDFVILFSRILTDKRVPNKQKLILSCVLGYVVMPIDLIPDFVPFFGLIDDLIIAIYGVHFLMTEIDRQIITENWPGHENILTKITLFKNKIDTTISAPLLKIIKNILYRFGIQ